jgi:hypothetical protein
MIFLNIAMALFFMAVGALATYGAMDAKVRDAYEEGMTRLAESLKDQYRMSREIKRLNEELRKEREEYNPMK